MLENFSDLTDSLLQYFWLSSCWTWSKTAQQTLFQSSRPSILLQKEKTKLLMKVYNLTDNKKQKASQ